MASQPIYQFYSELADVQPKIWRRFQVLGNISLAQLGYIVMTLYEMKANHLFSVDYPVEANVRTYKSSANVVPFPVQEERYYHFEIPSDETCPDTEQHRTMDATGMTLKRLSRDPGLLLSVMYDYGDGWEIQLRLEAVLEDAGLSARDLPRVLEGEGFGIIEDCGGPGGLIHLVEVFHSKSGEEYISLSRWLGQDELDLSAFDLDDMNFRLKKVPRIFREFYEYNYAPTKRSLEILERAYLKKLDFNHNAISRYQNWHLVR